MTCRYCEGVGVRREMIGEGLESIRDAPKCAFKSGDMFESENWDCGTMNRLRQIVEENGGNGMRYQSAWLSSDQQNLGTISLGDGRFITIGWYKSRGRTEYAALIDQYESFDLFISDARLAIEKAGLE